MNWLQLAPPPPLHEDFVFHWKKFMKHYLNLSFENKAAVELTNLPGCLDRLREVGTFKCWNIWLKLSFSFLISHFQILVYEDHQMMENTNSTEIGPCMEYLLKHNLLDLLVSIAIFDEPPGIKQCILRFFSKTLTQINEPNIAHSAIYTPLMVGLLRTKFIWNTFVHNRYLKEYSLDKLFSRNLWTSATVYCIPFRKFKKLSFYFIYAQFWGSNRQSP